MSVSCTSSPLPGISLRNLQRAGLTWNDLCKNRPVKSQKYPTSIKALRVIIYALLSLPLSFNDHFSGGPGLVGSRISPLCFLLKQDDGCGGDNWSYKTCKAPAKLSPSSKQTSSFIQARCPACCTTNSVRALKGRIYIITRCVL